MRSFQMKFGITFFVLAGATQFFVAAEGPEHAADEAQAEANVEAVEQIEVEAVKSWDEMSPEERKKWALDMRRQEQMVSIEKPDPNEVVCIKREARIGSRVKRNICKTRAEFRREQEKDYDELLARTRVDARRRLALPNRNRVFRDRPRVRPARPDR